LTRQSPNWNYFPEERDKIMTQNKATRTENDTFTMQAADSTELEQVEGGLVLTDGPIYALKSSPGADGYLIQ